MSKNYFFICPQKKFDYKLRQAQAALKNKTINDDVCTMTGKHFFFNRLKNVWATHITG